MAPRTKPAIPIPLPWSFLIAKIPKITDAIPSGILRNQKIPVRNAKIPAMSEMTPSADDVLARGATCGCIVTGAGAGAGAGCSYG